MILPAQKGQAASLPAQKGLPRRSADVKRLPGFCLTNDLFHPANLGTTVGVYDLSADFPESDSFCSRASTVTHRATRTHAPTRRCSSRSPRARRKVCRRPPPPARVRRRARRQRNSRRSRPQRQRRRRVSGRGPRRRLQLSRPAGAGPARLRVAALHGAYLHRARWWRRRRRRAAAVADRGGRAAAAGGRWQWRRWRSGAAGERDVGAGAVARAVPLGVHVVRSEGGAERGGCVAFACRARAGSGCDARCLGAGRACASA
jgi:hypothetical protein